MIWVNFCKNYLASFAAKDIDSLNDFYDDDTVIEDYGVVSVGRDSILDDHKIFFENLKSISIEVQNAAYNNKLIFIKFSMKLIHIDLREEVVDIVNVVTIGDNGKIKHLKFYRG